MFVFILRITTNAVLTNANLYKNFISQVNAMKVWTILCKVLNRVNYNPLSLYNSCIPRKIPWILKPCKKRGCFTCKLCLHVKVYVYVHYTSVCQEDMLESHGHGQLFLVQDIGHSWPITSSDARSAFSQRYNPRCTKHHENVTDLVLSPSIRTAS